MDLLVIGILVFVVVIILSLTKLIDSIRMFNYSRNQLNNGKEYHNQCKKDFKKLIKK